SLTVRRRLGIAATPVSRLFGRRVGRYADSVLMADDDRTRCRAVLELSRITRLKGRGDAAQPAGLLVGSWRACRPQDASEHADAPRSRKSHAPILRGEYGSL
ncbi:MAG: hypothetical protein M3P13_11275, partial [Acidobacteriota bacterium]|nr:hypothetical protein [Acidobacteriota bacterium]